MLPLLYVRCRRSYLAVKKKLHFALVDLEKASDREFSPTIVDVKNIQLFLGSLLVNECSCINIGSSMFERNIPLRLQNVAKYCVYKMLQNRGVEELLKWEKS